MLKVLSVGIKFISLLVFVTVATCVYLIYYYARTLPDYSQLANYFPPSVTRIYSSEGKLIEEYALEHRVFVPITSIPQSLIEAFIAAEDKNFYKHSGVDFTSIARAVPTYLRHLLQKQKKLEGGSTITQQVVKNLLLTPERSLGRKIKEAVLSYMLSRTFTKDQILELYLNQIFLGKGYGVAIAAQNYFNKSVDELTLPESAFLAALPKAPSNYNPRTNYQKAKARRDYVIVRMLENNFITQEAAQEALDTPIVINNRDSSETITAGYYAENVREEATKIVGKELFYTGGLTIITPLDSNIQEHAKKALRKAIEQYDRSRGYRGPLTNIKTDKWQERLKKVACPILPPDFRIAVVLNTGADISIGLKDGSTAIIPASATKSDNGSAKINLRKGDVIIVKQLNDHYTPQQIPQINGGLIVMEPRTGKVIASQGGYDFDLSKFDRVTQAARQPGSVIKPFIYLAALENGMQPNRIFDDAPVSISQGPGMPPWTPKNYKGDFYGPITIRKGLEKSRNLITVRVTQAIGLSKVVEIIQRFGINTEAPKRYSMVLGSLETTLEKMTTAYAILANQGKKTETHFIEMIKDRNGKIIYQRDKRRCINCIVNEDNLESSELPSINQEPEKIITDEASDYQIVSMLNGVIERGTANRAKKLRITMAGKTGTTNDSKDTWFIGFTPNLVVGTYLGYDRPKNMGGATGSTMALPVFINFMETAYPNLPSLPFKVPSTIKLVHTGGIIEAFKTTNMEAEYDELEKIESGEEGIDIYQAPVPRNYPTTSPNSYTPPKNTYNSPSFTPPPPIDRSQEIY